MSKIVDKLREILGEDGLAALMRSELAGRLVRVPVDHSARAAKEEAIKAALDRGEPYTVAALEAGVSRSTACRVGKR